MRAFRTLLPLLLLLPLLAAGCGGDEPEPLPPTDDSSSSSTDPTDGSSEPADGESGDEGKPPPPPKGIKLANNEKAAYNAARKDYNKWVRISGRLMAKGQASKQTYKTVARYTFNPAGDAFYQSLLKYDRRGIRVINGDESKVRWEVPVKVDMDARMNGGPAPVVVWKRCLIRGDDFRVLDRNGDEIPQSKKNDRTVSRIEVRADPSGFWRATDGETVGHRC